MTKYFFYYLKTTNMSPYEIFLILIAVAFLFRKNDDR